MDKSEEKNFEEALDNLPDEVADFLYEGDYATALQKVSEALMLDEAKKSELNGILVKVIAQTMPKDELLDLAEKWEFNDGQKKLFTDRLEEYFFEPLLEMTNYVVVKDDFLDNEKPASQLAVSSAASIQENLATPAVIPPVQREQSITKPAEGTEKKIDPYREPIG